MSYHSEELSTKKLRQPSKKCISYIKSMISKGIWKEGTRIPSISKLSNNLNISPSTTLKVLHILERKKVLECLGQHGYYIKSSFLIDLYNNDLSRYMINKAKINLLAGKLLRSGGKQFGSRIFKFDKNMKTISYLNLITGKNGIYNWKAILESLDNNITIESVIKKPSERNKFINVSKRRELGRIIIHHKEELGIDEQ